MSVPKLFLSYCHADKDRMIALRKVLESRGVATWADRDMLTLGDDLGQLEAVLKGCDGVVQVLSPAALESDWLEKERDWALEALNARADFKLLPLRIELGPKALRNWYGRDLINHKALESLHDTADLILKALELTPKLPSEPTPQPAPVETNALIIQLSNPKQKKARKSKRI